MPSQALSQGKAPALTRLLPALGSPWEAQGKLAEHPPQSGAGGGSTVAAGTWPLGFPGLGLRVPDSSLCVSSHTCKMQVKPVSTYGGFYEDPTGWSPESPWRVPVILALALS